MNRDALETFRTCLGEPGWDDVVVGHDFGFLEPAAIQAWSAGRGDGPAMTALRELPGPEFRDFEARLWAACAEARGKTPRPGSARWAHAQDRWRLAILRDALATEATLPQLARRVERLYEQVGCPEDMLGMLRPSPPWSGLPATVDTGAILRFLDRFRLRPEPA
ncbi:MAG TPA: hypothetical protein VF804_09610 [Holophagaceae bacterium]